MRVRQGRGVVSEVSGHKPARAPASVIEDERVNVCACMCMGIYRIFLADYVLALEAEIRTLKHKFKTLEEQLEVLYPSKKSTSYPDVQPSVHSSTETAGKSLCLIVLCAPSGDTIFFQN